MDLDRHQHPWRLGPRGRQWFDRALVAVLLEIAYAETAMDERARAIADRVQPGESAGRR